MASLGFLRHCPVVAVLWLFCCGWIEAQQGSPVPPLEVLIAPRQGITVGDIIQVTVRTVVPKDWQVQFPSLTGILGDFTILESKSLPAVDQTDGKVQHAWQLQIACYRPGQFEIPAFKAAVADPSGHSTEITSPAVPLEIVKVVKENSPELRDLKGQEALTENYLWLWLGLAGAVVAAFLAWWLGRGWRRRQQPKAGSLAVPLLPPHLEAGQALQVLLAGPLTPRDHLFYFHLSEIIRRMIGRQFNVPTLEHTTSEILETLAQTTHPPLSSSKLEAFLSWCDLIKFACHQPAAEEQDHLLSASRECIDACRQAWEAARRAELSTSIPVDSTKTISPAAL